jgi:hypothetical protein
MNSLIIYVLIIFIVIFIYLKYNKSEKFDNTPTRIQPIFDIYKEPLFNDVIRFENLNNKSGMTQCAEKCNGSCVEYGESGIAHCFPIMDSYKSTFHENLHDNTEDSNRKINKINFPAML